ncbi:hypothetical protein Dimus_009159 [Dionaea muscipula]
MDNRPPHHRHFEFHNINHLSEPPLRAMRDENPHHGIGTFQGNDFSTDVADEPNDPFSLATGGNIASFSHGNLLQYDDDQLVNLPVPSDEANEPKLDLYLAPRVGDDGHPTEIPDIPDTCFNYINDLLREEDLDDNPRTLHDFLALDSYYQSLHNALHQQTQPSSSSSSSSSSSDHRFMIPPSIAQSSCTTSEGNLNNGCSSSCGSSSSFGKTTADISLEMSMGVGAVFPSSCASTDISTTLNRHKTCSCLIGKRHHQDQDDEARSGKQPAASGTETYEQILQYEGDLFCPEDKDDNRIVSADINSSKAKNAAAVTDKGKNFKGSNSNRKAMKKVNVIDHWDLLTRCAQAISNMDFSIAHELLRQIRQHSSPYGYSIERVAHYFVKGLEARLSRRAGSRLDLANECVTVSEILKANHIYVAAVPFKIMSYYISNKTIAMHMLTQDTTRGVHIIDFGISLGLQWPCIINNLSKKPGGPPNLRITGVDFPQPGFRPAERIEETGRCLARYCERFNVPFEYHAIAESWEKIKPEDLKIDTDHRELVVVNCLYRSQHLLDESVEKNSSPRGAFLALVRQIKPAFFIHGVVNGAFGVPIFMTRFKAALSHYSALFDLFEATMPREDHERLLLESKLFGKEVVNVIACEGAQRVERPEPYKRWQIRHERAGFEQVSFDQELLRRSRAMVRRNFPEQFVLDEDHLWAVQGWKGRILYAISCWRTGMQI